MRLVCALVIALAASLAQASRILLVPLDNRPAAGQFAQMIGNIDGANVQMPPYQLLGRFTSPGDPEGVLTWLEAQDYSDVSTLIVSADMVAYGGLIASRTNTTPQATALLRLRRFEALAQRIRSRTRVFMFSSVMRLAPTAVIANRPWRALLAKYVAARQGAQEARQKESPAVLALRAKVPPAALTQYDATRLRNHLVQMELVKMAAKSIDYLVIGQDDAQIHGPHIPETRELRALTDKIGIQGRVYFCEGVDQNANVLISRALLKAANWTPRIRVVYSDPYGRNKVGAYESQTVQETVRDQVYASGARITQLNEPYDYALYVNTPGRRELFFQDFLDDLRNEMDQNLPVSVADIDLAPDGTCDRELFEALRNENRLMKLISFAGWNTAGNTLGTSIPAANVTLLAQKQNYDPFRREVAQKAFLLHRLVDDVMYHRQTRPRAYALIDALPGAAREETYGEAFSALNTFVRNDMTGVLNTLFNQQLKGQPLKAPGGPFQFSDLSNVRVFLPWPRAYEVRVEFALNAKPVVEKPSSSVSTTVGSKGH